jgi:hypothetical protein
MFEDGTYIARERKKDGRRRETGKNAVSKVGGCGQGKAHLESTSREEFLKEVRNCGAIGSTSEK